MSEQPITVITPTPESKPVFVTFIELVQALETLHRYEKAYVDRLHDVWKLGAPTPHDSIIRNPKDYDERKVQPGNRERRLLLPFPLAKWIMETSAARGMPLTAKQSLNMVYGEVDYET